MTRLAAALVGIVVASAGCASGSQPSASPLSIRVAGAHSCPSDEAQDLTFSGGITGHIGCSVLAPACHRISGPHSPGVKVLIGGMADTKPVDLQIAFGNDHVGSFSATSIGDSPGLDQQGVTITGVGSWSSTAGTLTVSVEQAPTLNNQGRVSGLMDVKLTSASGTASVVGAWTCYKTLAGGDGWSTA